MFWVKWNPERLNSLVEQTVIKLNLTWDLGGKCCLTVNTTHRYRTWGNLLYVAQLDPNTLNRRTLFLFGLYLYSGLVLKSDSQGVKKVFLFFELLKKALMAALFIRAHGAATSCMTLLFLCVSSSSDIIFPL